MCAAIFQDAFFAAVAAVGFASISNPPRRAYPYCAFLAAVGHSLRYVLMLPAVGVHIIPAGTLAAFVVGMLAVWVTPRSKCPAETCFFPALLPMIPGVYAYRTVEAMLLCLYHSEESVFSHYLYLLAYNGLTCAFIIVGMVVGGLLPVFLFKGKSFRATRW